MLVSSALGEAGRSYRSRTARIAQHRRSSCSTCRCCHRTGASRRRWKVDRGRIGHLTLAEIHIAAPLQARVGASAAVSSAAAAAAS